MSPHTKKRKNAAAVKKDDNGKKALRSSLAEDVDFTPMTLRDISDRIHELCQRVPSVPDNVFRLESAESNGKTETDDAEDDSSVPTPQSSNGQAKIEYDHEAIRLWATALQTVLEEFNLLIACISPATYVWGTDRSGAADQNLSLLSNELVRSQEQILARVTPRLNDVLAPVVSLVTDKTVTIKTPKGEEIKQNYFRTTFEDPDYVRLCHTILARNAVLLRHVVLANFDKLIKAVDDFLNAQHSDSQHDARGFVY